MKILYTGSVFDNSGYGKSAREMIDALIECGAEVHTMPYCFLNNMKEDDPIEKTDGYSKYQQRVWNNVNDSVMRMYSNPYSRYDLHIIHLTPENYNKAIKLTEKENINADTVAGYMAWETTHIPQLWVGCINNNTDLVFVPSIENCNILRSDARIKKNIAWLPHAYPVSEIADSELKELRQPIDRSFFDNIGSVDDDDVYNRVWFYSIFQWSERKDPKTMLRTYLSEFDGNKDDVALYLKTYNGDGSDDNNDRMIKEIKRIKSSITKRHGEAFPPVYINVSKLADDEVIKFHKNCDVYLSTSRGEGFGMPVLDAVIHGKPAIVSDTAHTEFFMNGKNFVSEKKHLTDGDLPGDQQLENNPFIVVSSSATPVSKMRHIIWYDSDQDWKQVESVKFGKSMRRMYEFVKKSKVSGIPFSTKIVNESLYSGLITKLVDAYSYRNTLKYIEAAIGAVVEVEKK